MNILVKKRSERAKAREFQVVKARSARRKEAYRLWQIRLYGATRHPKRPGDITWIDPKYEL